MIGAKTARAVWTGLATPHDAVLNKAERMAELTIPGLLKPEGATADTDTVPTPRGSIGALLVNSLVNKMVLSMFSPTRPAQRLELPQKREQELLNQGMQKSDIQETLAVAERASRRILERRAARPVLYEALTHLVVTGNALLVAQAGGGLRVLGLPNFRVKRSIDGEVHTGVVKERIPANELEQGARDAAGIKEDDDKEVDFYILIERAGPDRYKVSQWVDDFRLPEEFDSSYPKEDCPYHFLFWRRKDNANYGTGQCEDFEYDLKTAATLGTAVADGAVAGTVIIWLLAQGGMLNSKDLENVRSGDLIPGRKEDLSMVAADNSRAVQLALDAAQHWERRLSQAFLLTVNIVRDAERVTAEELRMLAQEIETSLGGTYSSLAVNFQLPVARWQLKEAGYSVTGTDIEITIITGLDALSRGADLNALVQALSILGQIGQLPPIIQARLKQAEIIRFVGQGVGVSLSDFLLSDAEFRKAQEEAAASRVAEATATEAGVTAAQQGQV